MGLCSITKTNKLQEFGDISMHAFWNQKNNHDYKQFSERVNIE